MDLQRFEKVLSECLNRGFISIEEKELTGINELYFDI